MKRFIFANCLLLTAAFFISCNTNNSSTPTDTPTSGELKISVDESYSQITDAEIQVFEALYKKTNVHPQYKPEAEVIQDLLLDCIRVAITCRELNTQEKKIIEQRKTNIQSVKIAYDAIAFVVNNENTDTLLTQTQLTSLLQGKDTLWKSINKESNLGSIRIVFDNTSSANARYVHDSILSGQPFPKNCFAVQKNTEVIEYVSNNKNSIGIISVNWISDKDDSLTVSLMKKIKVIGISKKDHPESVKEYKKPYQSWIYDKSYPFTREVFMLKTGRRAGIGTGFVSFVAGEKGQLIIHKSGMVAGTAPIRMVKIK